MSEAAQGHVRGSPIARPCQRQPKAMSEAAQGQLRVSGHVGGKGMPGLRGMQRRDRAMLCGTALISLDHDQA